MIREVAVATLLTTIAAAAGADSYSTELEQWRQRREASLKSDSGWLTVSGLFWLAEGGNTIGSDPSNKVELPASAPGRLGVIERRGSNFTLHYADQSRDSVRLEPDTDGRPTMVERGPLTFWVIHRGEKFGIRLRDRNSRFRREFTGCKWFPVKPEYRIRAKFVPAPKTLRIPSVIGVTTDAHSPGYVEFAVNGETVRLRPTGDMEGLSFVFRDGTSGKTTYGASRFLTAEGPKNGEVILDFNRAYNPPCAFTPYATCPLPTRENRLKAPIAAGEMDYPHNW